MSETTSRRSCGRSVPWRLLLRAWLPSPRRVARGDTVPTVDILGQKHRQLVVDREAGQYLGHPTTVLLKERRVIGSFETAVQSSSTWRTNSPRPTHEESES